MTIPTNCIMFCNHNFSPNNHRITLFLPYHAALLSVWSAGVLKFVPMSESVPLPIPTVSDLAAPCPQNVFPLLGWKVDGIFDGETYSVEDTNPGMTPGILRLSINRCVHSLTVLRYPVCARVWAFEISVTLLPCDREKPPYTGPCEPVSCMEYCSLQAHTREAAACSVVMGRWGSLWCNSPEPELDDVCGSPVFYKRFKTALPLVTSSRLPVTLLWGLCKFMLTWVTLAEMRGLAHSVFEL